MTDKRYSGEIERLRSPERLARMEVGRVVAESLNGAALKSALDIGTGSGIFAEAFAKHGLSIAGVDLREEMLEAARAYVRTGDFKVGDMEALPFPDATFDLVFMGHVLHEAGDLTTALREARRVARRRVCALEWPFRAEEMGPPLDHRLAPSDVLAAAHTAGFAHSEVVTLEFMTLFRLEKSAG